MLLDGMVEFLMNRLFLEKFENFGLLNGGLLQVKIAVWYFYSYR